MASNKKFSFNYRSWRNIRNKAFSCQDFSFSKTCVCKTFFLKVLIFAIQTTGKRNSLYVEVDQSSSDVALIAIVLDLFL